MTVDCTPLKFQSPIAWVRDRPGIHLDQAAKELSALTGQDPDLLRVTFNMLVAQRILWMDGDDRLYPAESRQLPSPTKKIDNGVMIISIGSWAEHHQQSPEEARTSFKQAVLGGLRPVVPEVPQRDPGGAYYEIHDGDARVFLRARPDKFKLNDARFEYLTQLASDPAVSLAQFCDLYLFAVASCSLDEELERRYQALVEGEDW